MSAATEWRTSASCEPEQPSANHRPTANFDRLARVYRWMEWVSFGPLLWICRCTFLDEMQSARRALVIGDGDGRFTNCLLATNRAVHIDAIDSSAAMLRALARRSAANADRVRILCLDARDWRARRAAAGAEEKMAAQYDLIVTHFFLDCLTTDEVHTLAEEVAAAAAPGTFWVVSEFAVPQSCFGRLVAQPLVAFLYTAFGLLTGLQARRLPNHAGALRNAGFVCIETKPRLGGLLVSELWHSTNLS